MGFSTEHRGRGPNVFVPGTGQFLTQHVLEPTRAARVLDIVLSSQKYIHKLFRGRGNRQHIEICR